MFGECVGLSGVLLAVYGMVRENYVHVLVQCRCLGWTDFLHGKTGCDVLVVFVVAE